MAWTTPADWTTGQLVTAADMNAQVRDNLTVLKTSISDAGLIVAITSTYFASLNGASLTGVALTASGSSYTAGTHNFDAGTTTRLVIPVGADQWAT